MEQYSSVRHLLSCSCDSGGAELDLTRQGKISHTVLLAEIWLVQKPWYIIHRDIYQSIQ